MEQPDAAESPEPLPADAPETTPAGQTMVYRAVEPEPEALAAARVPGSCGPNRRSTRFRSRRFR